MHISLSYLPARHGNISEIVSIFFRKENPKQEWAQNRKTPKNGKNDFHGYNLEIYGNLNNFYG